MSNPDPRRTGKTARTSEAMNSSPCVLLTPGTMGPAEWACVSGRLAAVGYRVFVDTELSYDRGVATAAGTQLERLRDTALWGSFGVDHVDLAVGFGVGAGPAAAMVADGRATSSILIDPDLTMLVMKNPDDLEVLAPGVGLELGLAIGERMEPFTDNLAHGPITREMVKIMCGAFTGEAWCITQAELVTPFVLDRITIDRSQRPTEADLESSDWASIAAQASVSIWLTSGREPLADYLCEHGLDATMMDWGEAEFVKVNGASGELRI